MSDMRVWTCLDHDGLWVGVASVVVATSEDEARRVLQNALRLHGKGLKADMPFTLQEMPMTGPSALILQDGDY